MEEIIFEIELLGLIFAPLILTFLIAGFVILLEYLLT
jgi:hypothetical protein